MSTNITINRFEVEDFVSIDHGKTAVSLTIFHGKVQVGAPGWANEITFSPEQAEAVGKELIERAAKVRLQRGGGRACEQVNTLRSGKWVITSWGLFSRGTRSVPNRFTFALLFPGGT